MMTSGLKKTYNYKTLKLYMMTIEKNSNKLQTPRLHKHIIIKHFFFNEKVYFKMSREKADPEKSVLPAILYINTNHESFTDVRHKGFMICVGWWDFSVKFGVFF